jgi:hypothetical protein
VCSKSGYAVDLGVLDLGVLDLGVVDLWCGCGLLDDWVNWVTGCDVVTVGARVRQGKTEREHS